MIQKLKGRLIEIENRMTAINKDAAERLLTAEEKTELGNLQGEHADLQVDLKLRENIQNQVASTSQPLPKVTARPARSLVETSPAYKHMGAFLQDVMKADHRTGRGPERLMNAVSSAGVEGTDAAGGFAVPADLRREIQEKALSEESLLSHADRYSTFSRQLKFPVDAIDPWSTQYGADDIHVAETGTYSEVTPSLSSTTVTIGKIGAACSVSEELMEDALAMGTFVSRKLGERLVDRINFDIISGSGANGCVGFLNWGNKKTVATGSENASLKLSANNVVNMYYAMAPNHRANACWLVSPALEPYLVQLQLSGSTQFARPGDFLGTGFDASVLMGRPVTVLSNKAMAAAGSAGDIIFCDCSQYLAITKGEVATDVTPYVYWLNDAQTFKTHIRIGGVPWRSAPYTLADGSTTRADFVVLGGGR
jgi:HK97 family phage major capsid protein